MGTILQLSTNGIVMGFICALVAIEYTLIWNSTGLLSFSHDKVITVGAYTFAATFTTKFSMNKPLTIVLIFMLMGVLGSIIASGVFSPLRHMCSNIFAVMGIMMLGRVLAEAIRLIYGPVPFTIENWLSGTVKIGAPMVTKANVIVYAVAILIVVALQLSVSFVGIGKAMRCVAQNRKAAALMGINMAQSICVTMAVSPIIRSIIGMLIIPLFSISTTMAASIGLKGFSAGVIGGLGYLPGAILGGLFIGMVENLAVVVLPAVYKDIVSLVLLIIFLPVHPSGFLGKKA